MKKLFLSLLMALTSATAIQAQSSQVATLSHEGTVTAYYGAEALVSALSAANDGDIITLSGGSFTAAKIAKSVTIRGAGMEAGANGQLPTVIQGNFNMSTDNITLEGIYNNGEISIDGYTNSNNIFLKCRLNTLQCTGGGNAYNNRLIHCKVAQRLYSYKNSSFIISNSVVKNPGGEGVYTINNCLLLYIDTYSGYYPNNIANSSISNSYVFSNYASGYNSNVVTFNNAGNRASLWTNSTFKTNVTVDPTNIFEDFTNTYNDNLSFKLKSEAAALYLGSDETQISIYGGNMPFDPTPTNPQITKAKVAGKSTSDGKLKVELEVNGANH